MNSDSGNVNADSGGGVKSVHFGPECAFTFSRNIRSLSTRIGVHVAPEYAGRKIKRYPEDKQREELRLHMANPEPKKILSQRKSMVEPVFSALRGIQGLERFRRKGLLAVKLEFTLHAIAYTQRTSRCITYPAEGTYGKPFA